MALNLKNNGNVEVIAFDISEENRKNYSQKGLSIIDHPKNFHKHTNKVVCMLPNHNNVKEACISETGLFNTLAANSLVIDSSTIAPKAAEEIHEEAKKRNINFVDAPVSGGVGAA